MVRRILYPLVIPDRNISRNQDTDNPTIIYIYILCMSNCLFVSLYPINVKAEIGTKLCVGPFITPGKVVSQSF